MIELNYCCLNFNLSDTSVISSLNTLNSSLENLQAKKAVDKLLAELGIAICDE